LKTSPKSPKRDENSQANFPSRVKDTVTPSFLKGRGDQKQPRERIESALEIGQRVKTFIKDMPVRGTVCYIGDEKDSSGYVHRIVGLELVGNPYTYMFCSFLNVSQFFRHWFG